VVTAKAAKPPAPKRQAKISRYGLYWAQLDPTRGSEIAKTRSVVVVSPDEMNHYLETVVVCPLTSQLHPQWASRVACACNGVASEIAVDQIRTVSKSRLTQYLGQIEGATAFELRRVISLLYAQA
jgi:mRNA interferase MazF